MHDDPAPAWALEHYALGQEQARLSAGQGALEYERTLELLGRYLPAAPAWVADVGAGPGTYSLELARRGYRVMARDLSPLHVEQLKESARWHGLDVDAAVGDARDLDLPDASLDAVLLLGPLYHLHERAGRVRCLREAARVVRPGGIVAAAGISRWAVLLDAVLLVEFGRASPGFAAILDDALATGQLAPLKPAGFSGFLHRPEQLRDEVQEAGLQELALVSVEGPGAYLADLAERWAVPARKATVLDVARRLEGVPEMLGVGPHLLLVARHPEQSREDAPYVARGQGRRPYRPT